MGEHLGVISINLWQVLISLANLAVLFLILKKFLFKPVRKVLAERQAHVDGVYRQADDALERAQSTQQAWEEKMGEVRAEADRILSVAAENARLTGDAIVGEARAKAEGIVKQAEDEAEMEKRQAEAVFRGELANVSTQLAEKLLAREINEKDHTALIDSFIEELGEKRDADQ